MTDTHRLARRRELGGFLRAHRERLGPGDVGLPATGRRRTPGLRREEVAALSGVGLAWYTWLEQGRVGTSREVLEAVGRTLRLDPDARAHVLRLAGYAEPEPEPEPEPEHEPESGPGNGPESAGRRAGVARLLESWPDSPAVLLDGALAMTAWNDAYRRTFPDPARLPAARRNLLLQLVADPAHQRILPDWQPLAIDLYRHVRTRADARPDDPRLRALTALLAADRPDLADWWACRSVGAFTSRTVEAHPGAEGARTYRVTILHTPDAPGAAILLWV
ncbi:helix-turn-helix transcriptional regulator [Streptomyces sp. NPDC004267]|uniref:helix-turn-helix transcriptional regulator n=1 Tax=Streptomyces sp. NPDC004267 TaxID=3364694 RepID=UPI0036AE9570